MSGKSVYFWNWKKEAYHLVMRYKRDFGELFKFGNSLSEIVMIEVKNSELEHLSDVTTNG